MNVLTLSIINHRNENLLPSLLQSIVENTYKISTEIFVVVNVRGYGISSIVRDRFPQVTLLCNDEPKGFAANNNQVLCQATGQYIVLLNDDMLLLNNALERMVSFMDAHPEVGATGCKLRKPNGTLQRSAWIGFPSIRTVLIDLFYFSKLLPRLRWTREHEAALQDSHTPVEVDHVLGACLMMRRETLEAVGLLDESFFMFLEETDWCYRARKKGWKIFWLPDAEILHYGQQSVSKEPERFIPLLYENYYRFIIKYSLHNDRWKRLILKLLIATGTILRAGVWTIRMLNRKGQSLAMAHGYLRAFRQSLSGNLSRNQPQEISRSTRHATNKYE